MNPTLRNSRATPILQGAIAMFLLLTSLPASAQTFFGSGGATNTATDISNVGLGYSVLSSGSTGINNTAIGYKSLVSNTSGAWNTALGAVALNYNTIGNYNTAIGAYSLTLNTSGSQNTAVGKEALLYNTTGESNSALGFKSLYNNIKGYANTANGVFTLYGNTKGNGNTANGYGALFYNTTGSYNVSTGYQALYKNSLGSYNVANGYNALFYANKGKFNIGIGYAAGYNITEGSYNIDIGNLGVTGDSGAIRIGIPNTHTAAYIAGINGATISSGVAVYIDANGQLGTVTSSRRFKSDIKSMGTISDRLLQLRPVTFRYKTADSKGGHPLQYGLIAEEVAKVFPNLVQYDKQGKAFTVYYHLLTPMLLNQLQKEHSRVEALNTTHKAEITALKAELASMKQAQAAQQRLLTQLAAYVQSGKPSAPSQKANFVQH